MEVGGRERERERDKEKERNKKEGERETERDTGSKRRGWFRESSSKCQQNNRKLLHVDGD